MMCHFKQLPYLAWAERYYWSRFSYTSYFVHEAQQDVLSYILIDGINIFLSPRCTSNRWMWTCLASVVNLTSQSFHLSTDSGMTCDGPVPVMLQETSVVSVIDFGKGEGGGSRVEAPAAPHHHSQQPLWHPATHSGRWTPALRGTCQDYQKEEKERLRVKEKKISEWMYERER